MHFTTRKEGVSRSNTRDLAIVESNNSMKILSPHSYCLFTSVFMVCISVASGPARPPQMLPHLQRHCGDAARLRNVLRALLDMIQVCL